jgi:PAS domain S-box-containing protein
MKRMEEALKEAGEHLRLAVQAGGVGIWNYDVAKNLLVWDAQMYRLYGVTPEQFGGAYDAWLVGVHPEDRQRGDHEIQLALRGEKNFDTEFRVVWPDGSIHAIRALATVQHDATGKLARMVGTNWDITAERQAAAALRWNRELLQLMSGSSPLGFLVVDNRTDSILYFNQRFCEVWGIEHLADRLRRGELKNNDIIPDCLPVLADVPAFAASCAPLQDEMNRSVVEDEIAFTRNRTIRRFSSQIRDAEDRYYGRFYIFEDITERKRREAESVALLEKERQVSELKTRFISVTSHEFRTPMAAAMGSVDLLTNHFDRFAPAKRLELLARVNSSLLRMTAMLDEVLLLNRLDEKRIEVHLAPLDLRNFLHDLADEIRLGDRDAHRFELYAPNEAVPIVADTNLLHHILSNVLSNAVRYSPAGTLITVQLEADAKRVQVAVEDQGIGIPPGDRARIFEPFERGSNVGQINGTGLGLNIVKRMTEMIGGTVAVDSAEGRGTRFTLFFPREPAPAARS